LCHRIKIQRGSLVIAKVGKRTFCLPPVAGLKTPDGAAQLFDGLDRFIIDGAARAEELERLNRLRSAGDSEPAKRTNGPILADRFTSCLVHENGRPDQFVGLFEAGREVHTVANARVVQLGVTAVVADEHLAGGQPDAHAKPATRRLATRAARRGR